MTFTYTDDPIHNPLDALRMILEDTNEHHPIMDDEKLQWFIARWPNEPYWQAHHAAKIYAAHFGRRIDKSIDGSSASESQLQDHYLELADTYYWLATSAAASMVSAFSATSQSTLPSVESLAVKPSFRRGKFDNLTSSVIDEEDANMPGSH